MYLVRPLLLIPSFSLQIPSIVYLVRPLPLIPSFSLQIPSIVYLVRPLLLVPSFSLQIPSIVLQRDLVSWRNLVTSLLNSFASLTCPVLQNWHSSSSQEHNAIFSVMECELKLSYVASYFHTSLQFLANRQKYVPNPRFRLLFRLTAPQVERKW